MQILYYGNLQYLHLNFLSFRFTISQILVIGHISPSHGKSKHSSFSLGGIVDKQNNFNGQHRYDTKGHYNPEKEEHPRHAGDLPPVLSNDGTAWMEIYTGRFYPMDVVGRTIVLHEMPDDFKTQPSGDSGMKIACGEIKAWEQECKNKNGNE